MSKPCDREKKIAEIREGYKSERDDNFTYKKEIVEHDIRFLLSELERLQREYAEERAAHNAHVTELCEFINTNNMKQLQKRIEELQLEVNDWRDAAIKWNKRFEESEESHSETKELLHSTISEIKRYKQALEEIARGRFSRASYKARKALEGKEDA